MATYNIMGLAEDQMRLIMKTLDAYSRLSSGQFVMAAKEVSTIQKRIYMNPPEASANWSEIFERRLEWAAEMLTYPHEGVFGIFSPELSEDARIVYHIYKAMGHALWDGERSSVFSTPDNIVKGLEIRIEKVQ